MHYGLQTSNAVALLAVMKEAMHSTERAMRRILNIIIIILESGKN
jgi:hypothetical protein